MNRAETSEDFGFASLIQGIVQRELSKNPAKGVTISVEPPPPIMEYKAFAKWIGTTGPSVRGWLYDPKYPELEPVKLGTQLFVNMDHLMKSL